ncbi:MAG: aromatic-ring-hydroxylating dioxygenase subunit beta [Pigmentiphaga sp.]
MLLKTETAMRDALEAAKELVAKDFSLLDQKRWDEWLELFDASCEYWVPTWLNEEMLSSDPTSQIAHIFYSSRSGLEDRVLRIKSGKSPASSPARRTCHTLGNVVPKSASPSLVELWISWTCDVYEPHSRSAIRLFGHAEYRCHHVPHQGWTIRSRKTVVLNDFLPSVVDVYCL